MNYWRQVCESFRQSLDKGKMKWLRKKCPTPITRNTCAIFRISGLSNRILTNTKNWYATPNTFAAIAEEPPQMRRTSASRKSCRLGLRSVCCSARLFGPEHDSITAKSTKNGNHYQGKSWLRAILKRLAFPATIPYFLVF